ncbi:hypothetical protein Poli38472_012704 [Pythium oligandrum]|uniref:Uncharacterized protein n=1 Tax=Pythium oligandrum TaxID=41045 RepID=A0A8K1FK94_PYTOL|nr:hypothetical protein Poli38472_012704 [Pythium oligandrum]|eukprot:TMW61513.1 hypothetical protein Poli38472_012704 [Pythium oligandrum]
MPSTLEAFFTHGDAPCALLPSTASAQEDSRWSHEALLYLHSPQDAGQTSLLLQYGFSRAKSGQGIVLVLCGEGGAHKPKPTVVPLAPCAVCHAPVKTGMDNDVWRRVRIKYIPTSDALQTFAWSLQLAHSDQTSVLLVDSFDKFFTMESMGPVYQTLAALFEARRYMAETTGHGQVVLSGGSDAFFLHDRRILQRWCRFLRISRTRDDGSFVLGYEDAPDDEEEEAHGEEYVVGVGYEYHLRREGLSEGSFGLQRIFTRRST